MNNYITSANALVSTIKFLVNGNVKDFKLQTVVDVIRANGFTVRKLKPAILVVDGHSFQMIKLNTDYWFVLPEDFFNVALTNEEVIHALTEKVRGRQKASQFLVSAVREANLGLTNWQLVTPPQMLDCIEGKDVTQWIVDHMSHVFTKEQ